MSRDTQPRLGVAVLVCVEDPECPGRGGERVILGQRARGGNVGKWVLPGGGVEMGEHWRYAGQREFLEETGLRIRVETEDVLDVMEFIGDGSHRVCLVASGELAGPLSEMHPTEELSQVRAFLWREIPWEEVSPRVRKCLEMVKPPDWHSQTIACAHCGKAYPRAVPPPALQGIGCSAELFYPDTEHKGFVSALALSGYIQCYYGSRFDGDIYLDLRSEGGAGDRRPVAALCDSCIQVFLDAGYLEKTRVPEWST